MAKRGYIKIPRSLFETEEWKEKRKFSRFEGILSLYEQAAYTDGRMCHIRNRDILLRRGQLLETVRNLAVSWGWSPSAVDRFLNKLRNSRQDNFKIVCETISGTLATKITICDYDCSDRDISESETVGGTNTGTGCETVGGTYIEIKDSKDSNQELKEIPTNLLVRDFKIACAQADKREAAYDCFAELMCRGYFGTAEAQELPREYLFLAYIWRYYPELQRKLDAPLITWQARNILKEYGSEKDDISRVVERMANEKGLETKRNSFYFTLREWLRSDFERKEREQNRK